MIKLPPLDQYSSAPVFNIKAVVHQTQVSAYTLRAWERRYSFPQPTRTPGGDRLYSARDVALIAWIRDQLAEGMMVGNTVTLVLKALAAPPPPPEAAPERTAPPRALRRLTDELTTALLTFDATQAEWCLAEAFALYTFTDVVLQMMHAAVIEIVAQHRDGEITQTMEQFAQHFVRRKVLGWIHLALVRQPGRKILVTGAPDDEQDLEPLLTALFLARAGWPAIYLGPHVPVTDLLDAISVIAPVCVCLAASELTMARQITPMVHTIKTAFPTIPVGCAGAGFRSAIAQQVVIPGIFLGLDPLAVSTHVDAMLASTT